MTLVFGVKMLLNVKKEKKDSSFWLSVSSEWHFWGHSELNLGKKCYLAGQMHCLLQMLKSTFFEIFSSGAAPKGPSAGWEKMLKTLSLAFEVIVQPPKHTYEITLFSSF